MIILGSFSMNELVLDKKTIDDKYPVHVGNAVLQFSKLHFLKYVFLLNFICCYQ